MSFFCLLVLFLGGFLVPEGRLIPVSGASQNDWHKNTFWFEASGSSMVQKGIDIFADKGAPIAEKSEGPLEWE